MEKEEISVETEKIIETVDKAPFLRYEGRGILIKTDGQWYKTSFYIDGKKIDNITELQLNVKIGHITEVTMTLRDI